MIKSELFLRLFLKLKNDKSFNFNILAYFMSTLFYCYFLPIEF